MACICGIELFFLINKSDRSVNEHNKKNKRPPRDLFSGKLFVLFFGYSFAHVEPRCFFVLALWQYILIRNFFCLLVNPLFLLMELGLSGGPDAGAKRLQLLKKLNLPQHMSSNAMLQALNLL
ncbi:MAG: DUF4093 domain-containing protein, partial [Christensenellaceae bacterium]|nr:DUF4093 domain-containing protein [Christensenellaceae bacterium]